jgi:hypothetical protein
MRPSEITSTPNPFETRFIGRNFFLATALYITNPYCCDSAGISVF